MRPNASGDSSVAQNDDGVRPEPVGNLGYGRPELTGAPRLSAQEYQRLYPDHFARAYPERDARAYFRPDPRHPLSPGASRNSWWHVLLIGLALYIIGLLVLVTTRNPNLAPTVTILGSFLVPVVFVDFFFERRYLSHLTMATTARCFIYGGTIGVFLAAILEPLLVPKLSLGTAFAIGAIEEGAKLLALMLVLRGMRHDAEVDGIILGAATGMGFAALESTGYAFTIFLSSGGNLYAAISVTLVRALFSPVGHGTWTAILAGTLFRDSTPRRYRLTGSVIGAYLLVVVLHGLWDGLPTSAFAAAGPGWDVFLAQVVIGVVGLGILWWRWREARRLQLRQAALAPSELAPLDRE